MKPVLCLALALCPSIYGAAQGNWVPSGGEIANFGVADIATNGGLGWISERAEAPGYFSAIDTASYTGCSDNANINGYVKKYGNTAFIFPVGTGSKLRTIEISAPILSTDTYATAWIAGNPSANNDPTSPFQGAHSVNAVTFPIAAVSTAGQWDWQVGNENNLGNGTTGTGEGIIIKVSIPDMTQFSPTAGLRLVGWNGTSWIDLSKSATATGNTENNTLSGIMIANISAIAIGRIVAALPVKLANFTASSSNCNTLLNWETTSEINADKFIVEQSFDANHFTEINSIPASGSFTGNIYRTVVAQPLGLAYYRLKIMDKNGAFVYSPIVAIKNTCNTNEYMQVYPNPVSSYDLLHLKFSTSYQGKAELSIFNSVSQKMISNSIIIKEGINLIDTDVLKLPAGNYFIRLISADGKLIGIVQKFIKQ